MSTEASSQLPCAKRLDRIIPPASSATSCFSSAGNITASSCRQPGIGIGLEAHLVDITRLLTFATRGLCSLGRPWESQTAAGQLSVYPCLLELRKDYHQP